MKEKIKVFKYGIIILLAAIVVSIPLFWKDLNVYLDDGIQHISRAYLTDKAIERGENITVLSDLSNGFGYSWNLFYGPLSTIAILICKLIMPSFVTAYKLVLFLGILLSGITMYFFVKKLTGNKNMAVISSVLYMTMPYHLNDMYIRNSLGEFLSFIFIPLVFLGMYNLFNKEDKFWLLIIGGVGLILTHNLMALITFILAFGYFCMNLIKLKDKTIRANLLLCIVFILCITAFYWLPLFETSISTKYAVYEDNVMSLPGALEESALNFKQLIVTPNKSVYVREIGPHILIMLCFSVAVFRQVNPKYKKEYIFFLCLSIFSLIMSTNIFPWKFFEDSMQLLQFAWRMLVISNFCLAIICSINMGTIIKNFKFRDAIIISIISILYICALKSFIPTTPNLKNIDEWDMGLVTGRENENSAGMGKGEYLPYTAYEDKFYIASREDGVLILEGTGLIEDVKKDGNKLTCKLEAVEDGTVFELPYIYYPGYEITIDGSKVDGYENENGFLAIEINTIPMSDLVVKYKGTSLMTYSKVFSAISVIFLFMVIYINKKDIAESEEVGENS